MSKGTGFTRVIAYFRTADLVEATSCLQAATEIVASRTPAPDVTRVRRHRRTKAERAAANDVKIERAALAAGE